MFPCGIEYRSALRDVAVAHGSIVLPECRRLFVGWLTDAVIAALAMMLTGTSIVATCVSSDAKPSVWPVDPWVEGVVRRLDDLLSLAFRRVQERPADDFIPNLPGLVITAQEIEHLLDPVPNPYASSRSRVAGDLPALIDETDLRWAQLRDEFGLESCDLEILAISIAVDLDLKYQRVFAWLQDDLTRQRPTVSLVLDLLCCNQEERSAHIDRLVAHAPLIQQRLLTLVPDAHQTAPPHLAHYLVPDPEVFSWLCGSTKPLPPLPRFCSIVDPRLSLTDIPIAPGIRQGIADVLGARSKVDQGTGFLFTGQEGNGQRETSEAIACTAGRQLVVADLTNVTPDQQQGSDELRSLFHHARLHQRMVFLEGFAFIRADTTEWMLKRILTEMSHFSGVSMLAIPAFQVPPSGPAFDVPFIRVDFPPVDVIARIAWWRFALGERSMLVEDETVRQLASQYHLRPARIIDAVQDAQGIADWEGGSPINPETLLTAAHGQSVVHLESFARKRTPSWNWNDIVLPPDQSAQLREIFDHARYRRIVHEQWKTSHLNHAAVGLNVLFSGASGTGKTMAAEVLAGALGLDLYTIEGPNTISKFIGETEKNIDRIFSAAYEGNVVLFFDEADAIFGKRSQVKDAHDRYANIEVGYLLQKVESHDGIVILGTNLRSNMDDAFTRRLHHVVEFPFPDETLREQLWRKHLAGELRLAHDIDLVFLARQFELAGGSIRSIVTNACFLAAAEQPVGMQHLVRATRREFQKMGRVCDEQTFGEALAINSPVPARQVAS